VSIAIGILVYLIGYRFGWEIAHLTVAKECERLGSFYVGKKTFYCTNIEATGGQP
jgi:hypothetical protein